VKVLIIVAVILAGLVLIGLAMALKILKQYEQACCSGSAGYGDRGWPA